MFTVRWVHSSVDDLALIWLEADSFERSLITQAAAEIDRRLRVHPEDEGESRERGRRILLIPPLGVKFRIDQQSQIVRVLTVWRLVTHRR